MTTLASHLRRLALALLIVAAAPAHTQSQTDGGNPAELIRGSTDRVLELLAEAQGAEASADTARRLAAQLEEALVPVVDFPGIARAVMGKHRSKATRGQQLAFAEVFRTSLISLYTRTFRAFEVEEARVQPLPPDFDAASDRTSVAMQVTTADGDNYDLAYSMRRDDDGAWVVRNIIVDGINLGLTYLNQFDGAMARHGSIDAVIDRWSEEMREQDPAPGAA